MVENPSAFNIGSHNIDYTKPLREQGLNRDFFNWLMSAKGKGIDYEPTPEDFAEFSRSVFYVTRIRNYGSVMEDTAGKRLRGMEDVVPLEIGAVFDENGRFLTARMGSFPDDDGAMTIVLPHPADLETEFPELGIKSTDRIITIHSHPNNSYFSGPDIMHSLKTDAISIVSTDKETIYVTFINPNEFEHIYGQADMYNQVADRVNNALGVLWIDGRFGVFSDPIVQVFSGYNLYKNIKRTETEYVKDAFSVQFRVKIVKHSQSRSEN
jgi:hypothetical protein